MLALVAAGCGGDDTTGDVVPRSTPELTAPGDVDLGRGSSRTNTTTTGTTTTPTTTAPAAPAQTAPATPAPSAPATGGATPDTGGGTAPDTGGASPGAFSEFCRQNPGACPDQ